MESQTHSYFLSVVRDWHAGFAIRSPPTQATTYSPADHYVVIESSLLSMGCLSVTLRAQLKCNDGNGPIGPHAYGGVVCVTVRFGFKGQRPNPPESS